MRKLFFAICTVLPAGSLLLAVMWLFVGCANYQYQGSRLASSSSYYGAPPPGMMLEDATAYDIVRRRDVENEAIRACIADTRKCQAMQMLSGVDGLDTQLGYTFVGMAAAGVGVMNPSQTNEMAEVKKELGKIKKSLGLTIQAAKPRKGR